MSDYDVFYALDEDQITAIKKAVVGDGKHRSEIMVLMNRKAIAVEREDRSDILPIHAVCVLSYLRPAKGWSLHGIALF